MLKPIFMAAALAALVAAPAAVSAAEPQPVQLDPINHQRASLTIVDDAGVEHVYTPEALEAMPTFRLVTRTPWREEAAAFEGVLLRDILRAHGLDDNSSISVVAENDYAVDIANSVWQRVDVLVATRVDGKAHSRRSRGPIQFVISEDVYNSNRDTLREAHLVWMAARITPAE